MHPLNNGSQVIAPPAIKPQVGAAGYFSESNDNGAPSYPGADWFNANIKEFTNLLNSAGVEFEFGTFDHLARAFSGQRNEMLRALVFTPLLNAGAGYTPNSNFVAPCVGQKCYVSEYETTWSLVQTLRNKIDEATKATSILDGSRTYAGYWGYGSDETGAYFTPPNWPEFEHYMAAGVFGNDGEFTRDCMQRITGQVSWISESFDVNGTAEGAFRKIIGFLSGVTPVNTDFSNASAFDFDSSRVVRTSDRTNVQGVYADPRIWLPKGVY